MDKELGREFITTFVQNLADIESGRGTPAFLSEAGLKAAKYLVYIIGRDGAEGISVSTATAETVDLTAKAAVNARGLTTVVDRAAGSVEGRLEAISIHRRPKFTVYRSLNNRAVTCLFGRDKDLDDVISLLGKRVNVSGTVSYNRLGDPFRVEVESIRRLRDRSELPSITEMTGSDPDFTGGMSTEEYIERLRVG